MNCLKRFCMKVCVPRFPIDGQTNGQRLSLLLRNYYRACENSTMDKCVRVWYELCGKYAHNLFLENVASTDHYYGGVDPKALGRAEKRLAATYRPPGFLKSVPDIDDLKEMCADQRVQAYVVQVRMWKRKQKK